MRQAWHAPTISGETQWVSVRGKDSSPVLIYLHGGPGGSEFGPRRKYLRELEDRWRLVEWEQRGAGRSYRGDESAATLTPDALVNDGIQVVEWACSELGVKRVVIVGHSFGTLLGIWLAQRAPGRIAAFVGAGQIVNWALQESRGYAWALDEARRRKHAKAIASLERLGPPTGGVYAIGARGVEIERRWLSAFGGVSADPSFFWSWVLSIFTCGEYPLAAKLRFMKAMRRSMDLLWPVLAPKVDLLRDVRQLEVPVHLFSGRSDRITPADLVEEWLTVLRAPAKRHEIVEGAGHLNLFEAPAKFISFMEPLRDAC
jgi:pimeloyl-ACP methyl ester carboxylesterase